MLYARFDGFISQCSFGEISFRDNIGVLMKTYLLGYLLLGPLVANSIQDQKINFFGFWRLDANKSISENKFLDSFKDHVQHKSRHIVTFSIDGSYQEKIGDVVRTGTWSKYTDGLVVARLENDEKFKQRKKNLKDRLKSQNLSRYQQTRLHQKLHFLDRSAFKTYKYENGFIVLTSQRFDQEIKLYFKRGM